MANASALMRPFPCFYTLERPLFGRGVQTAETGRLEVIGRDGIIVLSWFGNAVARKQVGYILLLFRRNDIFASTEAIVGSLCSKEVV